ncbi:tripartite tricarboxylate transporter substrate binding protein [Roseateles oligotrophus]|uniref:Tripartite tricarboxylate transporter substrate binding protein n=1 Tax=Roseateles oligotrophus TaxID=1769250 RepID=A0ABT2YFM3_9BURK|nr:tripartite tricarboxylate transporter substrate binding protein [Roseateles oligotrophus]MCV2368850.1 tripartite tricarboxylate transporter substrate binding protein [Roseateles oligotrophus]
MQRRILLSAGLALPIGSAWASPERFPARPITLICPWPPGGSSDAVMRAFAESAAAALGVPVVVESRPGVGGTLGATAMLRAAPDGYTLTQLPLGIYRLPHMQKMPFDPLKDLTHVIGLSGYTFGLAAMLDAPYKSLQEMVAWARAHPGMLTYGHTGTGTTPHLAVEEFAHLAGFKTQDVPFKGSAEITQAILGGHVQMMSGTLEFAPHVRAGKLRLLATLGSQRTKAFPDTPTVKESGWDTVTESPFGIGGPKGMDPAVVRVLHDAFKKTLMDPKVLETLDKFQQPVIYKSTEEYGRYAVRIFEAERLTIARMGLAKKG